MNKEIVELSENNFECGYSVYGNAEPLIHITTISKESSVDLMKEFLKAVREYPKLRETIENLSRAYYALQQENKQLKHDLMELISVSVCPKDAQELTQLRQLKQRIEEWNHIFQNIEGSVKFNYIRENLERILKDLPK